MQVIRTIPNTPRDKRDNRRIAQNIRRMKMSDVTQGAESKRGAIAKREWVDENGDHTPDRTKAVGARYTYLKTGNSIERLFGDAGKPETMCAVMGYLTKVGNIVNSVVNADDYDGTADPMTDVKSWDDDLGNGIWREAAEGGVARGPKYDKDTMAGSLLALLTAKGVAKGDLPHYRARLEDKSYYAKVRGDSAVMAQYYQDLAAKGVAAPQAATDSLA